MSDWEKLIRLLKYLNGTCDNVLPLSADDLHIIKWCIDAAFAAHPDFKSHTGGTMTFGHGAVQSLSRKQKLNARSSTEAELVGADDGATPTLWTKLFMEAQCCVCTRKLRAQEPRRTKQQEAGIFLQHMRRNLTVLTILG